MKLVWRKDTTDGEIFYASGTIDSDGRSETLTVNQVVFKRLNKAIYIEELVHIHWSNAFKYADYSSCGGHGVIAVILSDGTNVPASGLYFEKDHHDQYSREASGLSAIVVGCDGKTMLRRNRRPRRDRNGYAL